MAQYDVYVNPNPRSREAVPYVVDIQSHLLDTLRTRLTVPLSRVGASTSGMPRRLAPRFEIDGERLSLQPHIAAGIDARLLRDAVASVAAHGAEIRDAMDAAFSGV